MRACQDLRYAASRRRQRFCSGSRAVYQERSRRSRESGFKSPLEPQRPPPRACTPHTRTHPSTVHTRKCTHAHAPSTHAREPRVHVCTEAHAHVHTRTCAHTHTSPSWIPACSPIKVGMRGREEKRKECREEWGGARRRERPPPGSVPRGCLPQSPLS